MSDSGYGLSRNKFVEDGPFSQHAGSSGPDHASSSAEFAVTASAPLEFMRFSAHSQKKTAFGAPHHFAVIVAGEGSLAIADQ